MTTLKAHGLELYRITYIENDGETDRRATISVRSCGAILYKADWRYNPPRNGYRDSYQGGHWSHLRTMKGRAHATEWKRGDDDRHQAAVVVWNMVAGLVEAGHEDVQVRGKLSAWPAWCKARR